MNTSRSIGMKASLAFLLAISLLLYPFTQAFAASSGADGGLKRLETILQPIVDAADQAGIEVAVAVKDLSGTYGYETLEVGSKDSYLAASTIKLALLVALMQEVEAGAYSLEDTITVTPEVVVGGAGTLKDEEFPQDITIERLARLMVVQSDNTATNVLIDLVGFERVEALIDELGFEVMQLGRKMMTTANPPVEENYVNAIELLELLEKVYNGEIMSAASTEQYIEWMKGQEVKTKFGAALPGKPIAHKTGELGDVSHDAGYFLVPGRELAISVLTKVTRPEDAGQAQALGNPIIQRIAKAVYNFQLDYPAEAVAASTWPELTLALKPIIDEAERNGIRVSVGVKDLSGFADREFVLGSKQAYAPASTIKLALVAALMQLVDAGELSLDDAVTVEPDDVVGGTGSLQDEEFPQDVTLERLARLTITQSDNTATNVLIDVVGLEQVAGLMDELGLEVMHLGRKMFASAPTPADDNYIDAADLITLLGAIYNGQLLSEGSSEQIIAWMGAQEVDTKFGSALPDAPIAHKTGENANVTHDAGYFFIPGKEIAISVLTEVTTTSSFNEAQAIGNPLVQEIAKTVYETLSYEFAYADVPSRHWARAYIEAAASASLIDGTSAEAFSPDTAITRAEFVSMLAKSLELSSPSELPSFVDVPSDSKFAADIAAAEAAGITNGQGGGIFGHDAPISRAEVVTMLVRAYEYAHGEIVDLASELTYTDAEAIPAWAVEAAAKIEQLDVVDGYADGTFQPERHASRAEAAKLIVYFSHL